MLVFLPCLHFSLGSVHTDVARSLLRGRLQPGNIQGICFDYRDCPAVCFGPIFEASDLEIDLDLTLCVFLCQTLASQSLRTPNEGL